MVSNISTNIFALPAPQPIYLSQQMAQLKIELCREYAPCHEELELHFEAIATAIFEKLGHNLPQMLKQEKPVTAEFLEAFKKEFRASIVGSRKRIHPSKPVFSHHVTGIAHQTFATKFSWGSWLSRIHKENQQDPPQLEAVQRSLIAIHHSTSASFLEKQSGADNAQLNFPFVHSLEYLAKCYCYHICPSVQEVEVSVLINNTFVLVKYAIEEIPLWMGASAYGLKPISHTEAPPIILYRGTAPYPSGRGSGISVLSNIDPLGVGYQMYWWGSTNLRNWLSENTQQGKNPAILAAHSQGGALATYTAVYNSTFVKEVYAFNNPGVSFIAERAWRKMEKPPKIFNFSPPSDVIPRLGSSRVGEDHLILNDRERKDLYWPQRLVKAHIEPLFEHAMVILKHGIKTCVPSWLHVAMQISILTPFYFAGLSALFVKQILFGRSYARPYTYLLGPIVFIAEQSFDLLHRAFTP